jgi:hypothetical protein
VCYAAFSLYRHLLGKDYSETYHSPRGEKTSRSSWNMVGSVCFLGLFLGPVTYFVKCIEKRIGFFFLNKNKLLESKVLICG